MEKPNSPAFAALLVERYGKDAYTRAVMYLMEKHKIGDQAGERLGLQLVMAVQQLLQARFPEDGIVPSVTLSVSRLSRHPSRYTPSIIDEQFTGCAGPTETQTRTVH
ncbi:MAG: hypothetical protein ACRYG8_47425 [Janthinobacterium lividum]